jgi:carbon storage regulator
VLVLTRKARQALIIDERIIVTVLEVDGDRVKLGIEAPPEVGILRQELCDEVRRANLTAAAPAGALRRLLPALARAVELPDRQEEQRPSSRPAGL